MEKISDKNSYAVNMLKFTGISSLFSILAILIMLFVCSFISIKLELSSAIIDFMVLLSCLVGCFIGGFANGRMRGCKGWLSGIAVGGVVAVLILLVAVCFEEMGFGAMTLIKLFVIGVSSAAGGICGVNKREKRIKF